MSLTLDEFITKHNELQQLFHERIRRTLQDYAWLRDVQRKALAFGPRAGRQKEILDELQRLDIKELEELDRLRTHRAIVIGSLQAQLAKGACLKRGPYCRLTTAASPSGWSPPPTIDEASKPSTYPPEEAGEEYVYVTKSASAYSPLPDGGALQSQPAVAGATPCPTVAGLKARADTNKRRAMASPPSTPHPKKAHTRQQRPGERDQ